MDRTQEARRPFTCETHPNYLPTRAYDSFPNYEGFVSLVLSEHCCCSAASCQLQVD
jgi:hypothetical protein